MALRYVRYGFSLLAKGSPLSLASQVIDDATGRLHQVQDNGTHIRAAVEWLLRAQSATRTGGVSEMYSLYEGWKGPYSETTGYIIPTLLNYYHATKDEKIREAALRMADWELSVQFPEGAFPGGAVGGKSYPIVFNTGQVLFGMVRAFEETKKEKYRAASKKAADWLCKVQHREGYWEKHEYLGHRHVYNSRVAWPLLLAHRITKNPRHKKSAVRFLDWAVSRQQGNGWYAYNGFYPEQEPLLHTIAYAIQGILEGGIILKSKKYVASATSASDALLGKLRANGSFAGSFDSRWNSSVAWSCLTGNSQMAIVYLRLHGLTGDRKYLEAATRINRFMRSMQDLQSSNPGIRGGIKGAYPIWGWYAPFCYANWAAKFFIDALMLEDGQKLLGRMS